MRRMATVTTDKTTLTAAAPHPFPPCLLTVMCKFSKFYHRTDEMSSRLFFFRVIIVSYFLCLYSLCNWVSLIYNSETCTYNHGLSKIKSLIIKMRTEKKKKTQICDDNARIKTNIGCLRYLQPNLKMKTFSFGVMLTKLACVGPLWWCSIHFSLYSSDYHQQQQSSASSDWLNGVHACNHVSMWLRLDLRRT